MPLNAHIVGWGSYLPQQRLHNTDLESRLDTSDEWIRTRTGISERRIASEGESTGSMAIEAAKQALEMAQFDPRGLDLIIVATISPEYVFPATACLVQDAVGAKYAAAFDISAGCSGFVYALSLADQAIRSGSARSALVIGAETLSRFVDWEDRSTCVLFGDGAGAVLLQGSEMPGGILSTYMGADGSGAELLYVPAGGAKTPACPDTIARKQHYLKMDGREVYRFAVKALVDSTREVLSRAELEVSDISLLIPHQANARITAAAARSLDIDPQKIMETVEWCGNTSAASVPIALCQALEEERIKEGDLLVMVGFGAGLTWAAAAVRWDKASAIPPSPWRVRLIRGRYFLARVRSSARRLWRRLRTFVSAKINGDWHNGAD